MNKTITLATEFVEIYERFKFDGKDHFKALELTEDEFMYKLDHDSTLAPTFFFLDNSVCEYIEEQWIISYAN